MYEYIKGELVELNPAYAVVDAGGVGYLLTISLQTYTLIEGKKSVKLYSHHVVREDVELLFGFADKDERELFRLLTSVSGVGGSTARVILSTYTAKEIVEIIANDDAEQLRKVKGVGLKTAQKIIVVLRDKVTKLAIEGMAVQGTSGGGGVVGAAYQEALAALTMLGFPKAASDKALKAVVKDNSSAGVEALVRMALKNL